ncbi:MAG: SMP-30/gluconolactonase/LRE family protein [Fimbriimonadales bacterium]|nr:SMP-30/gluconolactonase/LRE family protein [Fimbriimonadales bacterium]
MIALAIFLAQGEITWTEIVPAGSKVSQVARGFKFVEGPVWTKAGVLVFSDIDGDTIYVYNPSGELQSWRSPSNRANGNAIDSDGTLITCEQATRRVTRTGLDGKVTVLADRYQGKRFNAPNDLAVRNNGDIYFTDPPYGIQQSQEELGFYGVFRIKTTGSVELLARDMLRPNGIGFSPDQKTLYVSDSARGHLRAYGVKSDGTLDVGRVFADMKGTKPGVPDGLAIDQRGNIYCTGSGGVQVFTPSGRRIGIIETPEIAANCAFGGADNKTLFITARTGLYSIRLGVPGLR